MEKKITGPPVYTFEMLIEAQLKTDKQMKKMSAEADKRRAEADKRMKEMSAEADKRMKKMSVEADKRMKKMSAEADKRRIEADKRRSEIDKQMAENTKLIKELSQNIGGINNSNGLVAEQTIYNALERDMTLAGIIFYDIEQNVSKHRKALNLKGEYDIVLTNTDTIGIIETKYKVTKEDIIKLSTKQLENFRTLFPLYKDYKIILGIGGMSFDKNAEDEALARGIGIIKVIGDKVEYYTDNIKKY